MIPNSNHHHITLGSASAVSTLATITILKSLPILALEFLSETPPLRALVHRPFMVTGLCLLSLADSVGLQLHRTCDPVAGRARLCDRPLSCCWNQSLVATSSIPLPASLSSSLPYLPCGGENTGEYRKCAQVHLELTSCLKRCSQAV